MRPAVPPRNHFCACAGSVSTTADSRAIAAAAALARHWRRPFTPQLPPAETAILPCLDSILPVLLTLSLLHTCASGADSTRGSGSGSSGPSTLYSAVVAPSLAASLLVVPVALAALASRRCSQLGESGMLAGALAGGLTAAASTATLADAFAGFGVFATGSTAPCVGASALAAGFVAGHLARGALARSHTLGLPATASTLLTIGYSGTFGGIVGAALAPASHLTAKAVRAMLYAAWASPSMLLLHRLLVGALAGWLTLYGSVHGYYHGVMLPLILLEMEHGSFALLGALDAMCLCCTCAGVCAARALTARDKSEARALRTAVMINVGLGDYVEASYPQMAKSRAINAAAYLGAVAAGAALFAPASGPPLSSAYLPLPIALAVSGDHAPTCAVAAGLAFALPFAGTLVVGVVGRERVR